MNLSKNLYIYNLYFNFNHVKLNLSQKWEDTKKSVFLIKFYWNVLIFLQPFKFKFKTNKDK